MTDHLTRADVLRIVQEARDEGIRPDLSGADLRWADLCGADLREADLGGANLWGANLQEANLIKANLIKANLWKASLRVADLRWADLRGANLSGADLRGADLRRVDLSGAAWGGLRIDGLLSGQLTLTPTPDGWDFRIGCWRGTPDGLAALLDAPDDEWPEARGDERTRREALLRPVLALIHVHIDTHPDLITTLAEKWSTK